MVINNTKKSLMFYKKGSLNIGENVMFFRRKKKTLVCKIKSVLTFGGDKLFDEGREDHMYNYMWF